MDQTPKKYIIMFWSSSQEKAHAAKVNLPEYSR